MKHIEVEYPYDKQGTDFTGSVITNTGTIVYYLNGKPHREDGPAVEYSSGTKFWYLHGNFHRVDGPAVEHADGDKEWYYNNEFISDDPDYTLENFQRQIKLRIFK